VPSSNYCGGESPESHTGIPPVARPHLMRRGHGGNGDGGMAPVLLSPRALQPLRARGAGVGVSRNTKENNGAIGVTASSEVMNGRKRRESNPHLQNLPHGHRRVPIQDFRPTPSPHPRWPSRRDTCSCPRYRARARKLTLDQESAIRALTGTRSLRSLAADFGVSLETIRTVLGR
jgi:hypothetical protein